MVETDYNYKRDRELLDFFVQKTFTGNSNKLDTLEEKQEPAPCAVLNFQWEPLDSISMFYDMGDIVSEYDFLSLVPDCGCD